jgi:hypothetical protein
MSNDRPSSGMIHHVSGVDAQGYGIIQDIRYWVVMNYDYGPSAPVGPVVPTNRRPLTNPAYKIRAAQPGDVVTVFWFNDKARFLIIEGLDDRETCNP